MSDKNKVAHPDSRFHQEQNRGGHVPPLSYYGGDLMRIINIVCIAISLIVFAGGAVILGIRCLKLHDDALLHPPDPEDDDADPEHWPEDGEPL